MNRITATLQSTHHNWDGFWKLLTHDAALTRARFSRDEMAPSRCRKGARRDHRVITVFLAVVLALPMLLSPTHPIAVYGFLAHRYTGLLFGGPSGPNPEALADYLTSAPQLSRYRAEMCADMLDESGGRIFTILRSPDGTYRQATVRTWNTFIADSLPDSVTPSLDYKELPFLGDEVALWLGGETIVATGHYHPFGGGPSEGDRLARRFSATTEIIVSNGLIPFIYVDGQLVSYGEANPLNWEVFRSIRMMEKSLTMALSEVPVSARELTDGLHTFLAYLRESRQVDLTDRREVAREVMGLCKEFRKDYAPVFTAGFSARLYPDDLDRGTMLANLSATEMWALSVKSIKVASAGHRIEVTQ